MYLPLEVNTEPGCESVFTGICGSSADWLEVQVGPCTCWYFIYVTVVAQYRQTVAFPGSPSSFSPAPFTALAVIIKLQIKGLLGEQRDVALAKGN